MSIAMTAAAHHLIKSMRRSCAEGKSVEGAVL